jgi:gamma-glutamylcyclotransferase (GGCT)/AIG2-like uncharacterized protein YtfP
MNVFTYGTLMFPEVWQQVVGRAFASVPGKADGYTVYRIADAVYPGLIAGGVSAAAKGVVYLDLDEASLAKPDLFEDDFYQRQTLRIDCDDGIVRQADAYVVPIERRTVITNELWTADAFVASGGLEHFLRRFHGFARVRAAESGRDD